MKQKEISIWLKGICILIALMGLFFFGFIVPTIAQELKVGYPEVQFLFWPGLICTWVIGVLCYAILYQFWSVCVQIGKDNSFSSENARSFVMISRYAIAISTLTFAGMVFLGINHWIHPAFMLLAIGIIFIGIAITVLAAALSHLIFKAYEMKNENELTI